jgi:hypothetical protein
MNHRHLEEVDPSTLSPTELRERLSWRDELDIFSRRECPGREVGRALAIVLTTPAALPPR